MARHPSCQRILSIWDEAMTFAPIEDASVEGVRKPVSLTQSAEPPYTCSVCTVVWEEGHRDMSPYPEWAGYL